MALLLDTHTAIWWWLDQPDLSERGREAIATADATVLISAVSAIEIAIKFRIGKLAQFGDPTARYPALMQASRFESLPIRDEHALTAGLLPGDHRDPFDRIIAAQALIEGLTVVTRDRAFADFGCAVLW